jgi:prophage antirepressor-like protein
MSLHTTTSFTFNKVAIEVVSITCNGVFWLLANPFIDALAYSNRPDAIRNHVSEWNHREYKEIKSVLEIDDFSLQSRAKFINKSGLFELIENSKMVNSTEFINWLSDNILPLEINECDRQILELKKNVKSQNNEISTLKKMLIETNEYNKSFFQNFSTTYNRELVMLHSQIDETVDRQIMMQHAHNNQLEAAFNELIKLNYSLPGKL